MNCRSCFIQDIFSIIPLGAMPLANGLLKTAGQEEGRYNLEVMLCQQCGLAQLKDLIDPAVLFSEYVYFSSNSSTMLKSVQNLVSQLIPSLPSDALVLEVASNDGYLLKNYVEKGISVLGIDPAQNIAHYANQQGIPTRAEFFNKDYALQLVAENLYADIIHANNVMAHVPDIHGFIAGLKIILKKGGQIIIEVPYLLDLVENFEFDTIYHEHVYYFGVKPLRRIFLEYGLEIVDIEKISLHGGSLRLFIQHQGEKKHNSFVDKLEAYEIKKGLYEHATYRRLMEHISLLKSNLKKTIQQFKNQGKKVAAYGASAKGATLLNFFAINSQDIDFVVDISSAKQNFYMPGVRIPIRPTQALVDENIDAALLLTWNFSQEILQQQEFFRQQGGKFIIPFPHVRVV